MAVAPHQLSDKESAMAKANGKRAKADEPVVPALSRITVAGFKSIGPERSIEIRPLTLLAGANSSGKSSIMQPLLLLKQTLEAPYDPGALLLNGPNIKFTNVEQMLSRHEGHTQSGRFSVGLTVEVLGENQITVKYQRARVTPIDIESMKYRGPEYQTELRPGLWGVKPQEWVIRPSFFDELQN